MKNALRKLGACASYLLMLTAFVGTARASIGQAVPEIDSGSMAAAVALLLGGYLVTVSRFRRK
jgi:hypothetical protein